MKLPDQLKDMTIIDKSNVQESKVSVGIIGPGKAGKDHFICSAPTPILVAYADPNSGTAEGFIREGRDITLIPIRTFSDFENKFVPAVVNRQFEAATIAINTWSIIAEMMWLETFGASKNDLGTGEYIRGKEKMMRFGRDMGRTKSPVPGKPSYNLIGTAHLKEVTDKSGSVVGYRPDLFGGFKDMWHTCFDCVFAVQSEVAREQAKPGGPITERVNHYMLTAPPSNKWFIGDNLGGKGGYKALPPRVENTWDALMEGWGIKEEKK